MPILFFWARITNSYRILMLVRWKNAELFEEFNFRKKMFDFVFFPEKFHIFLKKVEISFLQLFSKKNRKIFKTISEFDMVGHIILFILALSGQNWMNCFSRFSKVLCGFGKFFYFFVQPLWGCLMKLEVGKLHFFVYIWPYGPQGEILFQNCS